MKFSRESQCAGKSTYTSKRQAKAAALRARSGKVSSCRDVLIVYRCEWCSRFHLGHDTRRWSR